MTSLARRVSQLSVTPVVLVGEGGVSVLPKIIDHAVVVSGAVAGPASPWKALRASRSLTVGENAGLTRGSGWRRSDDDVAVLEVAGRFGAMMTRQARDTFYRGVESTSAKRLTFMADARLLQRTTNLRWAGSVLWPTAAGMRAARLHEGLAPLGAPEMPTDERMGHRLLVVDWAIQHAAGFDQIVTEREFLKLERGGDPEIAERFVQQLGVSTRGVRDSMGRLRWFGFPLAGGAGLHFPDVFAVSGGGLRAIEMEVSPKNPARVKQTLFAYRRAFQAGQLQAVDWYVTPPVRAMFEGYQGLDGKWRDGLLVGAGFAAAGKVPDWSTPGSPIRLLDITPADDGLQYYTHQRVLPRGLRRDFAEWQFWRAQWHTHTTSGSVAARSFVDWVCDPRVEKMLTAAYRRP